MAHLISVLITALLLSAIDAGKEKGKTKDTESGSDTNDCLVGDIMHANGESIGVIGMTCIDDIKYEGTESKCVNGEIIDEPYTGDCNAEYPDSKCCQQNKPGDFGAAVCIKRKCIPYDIGDGSCLVGDIRYEDGASIGIIGTQCLSDNTYRGTESKCVAGQIIDELHVGICKLENPGSVCCQSGKPGDIGAATCITSECNQYTFDWNAMLKELQEKKALWEANKAEKYVYSLFTSCGECAQCTMANKYILVENDEVIYVEFDKEMNMIGMDCTDDDLLKPINENYFDIGYYYDKAIEFVEKGIATDCSDNTNDIICGGSLIFEYDDILFYPTKLDFIYNELVMDAGIGYSFQCITIYEPDGLNTNNEQCVDFISPPTPPIDTFDWEAAKEELEGIKKLWDDVKVNKYVYNVYWGAFTPPCYMTNKYILIEDDISIHVEFDEKVLDEIDLDCSNEDDIKKPVSEYYNNMDFYFERALAFVQQGIDTDCSNMDDLKFGEGATCGGRIEYEFNEILYYPMRLNLIPGSSVPDVGVLWIFKCMTVYEMDGDIDLKDYKDECTDFVSPTGEPIEPTLHPTFKGEIGLRDQDYIIAIWKERKMGWIDAEKYCINTYDSHLGTMLTDQDWQLSYDYSYFGGFNGLNDFDQNQQWSWIDGTECDNNDKTCSALLDLDENKENSYCSMVPWGGWKMQNAPCHEPHTQFWCNKVRGYHFVAESKSYAEAEEYCHNVYGTHLATIERSGDLINAEINAKKRDSVWIGLYYVNDKELNVWLDGTEYGEREYVIADLTGNSNCRTLENAQSTMTINADHECDEKLPFLCNTRVKPREYILESKVNVTFNEAQQICKDKYNTDLATVITEEEFSDTLLLIPYFEGAWIGLKKEENDEYIWLDGTECTTMDGHCISYWNEYSQPIEPINECGWIHQNGRASTLQCTSKDINQFLCNKPLNKYDISEQDRNGEDGDKIISSDAKGIFFNNIDRNIGDGNNMNNNNNNNINWIGIAFYVGILTIIFNGLIYGFKYFIYNKKNKKKEIYIDDVDENQSDL